MATMHPIHLTALLVSCLLLPSPARSQPLGPGLGNLAYSQSELFTSIAPFHAASARGDRKGMNVTSMFKGYMLFGYGEDSGNPGGGFAFYDVSNPRSPKLVFSKDVNDLRESHAYGLHSHGGRDYFAAQSIYGIHIYDVTDIRNPILAKDMRIPGVSGDDYSHGAWWLNWQAPYIFVARGADGFSVIDASTPTEAKLLQVMVDGKPGNAYPISKTGNFEIGPLFAVGNLLIVTTHRVGGDGLSALDISDPVNPRLLATASAGFCYSNFFNGGKIFCASGGVSAWEVTPTAIRKVGEARNVGAGGEYLHVQDGFIHVGAEDRYAKVEIATMKVINNSFSLPGDAQEGFATPFGNLVLLTDDHGIGSAFVVHQAEPDKTPPAVNFVSPANGASNQKTTSRIGLTFTDEVLVHTLSNKTFLVRPLGGQTLSGRYSSQTNIVNFSPDLPLQPNTTYEVIVPKGGIQDYVGNPVEAEFVSRFSTGTTVSTAIGNSEGTHGSLRAPLSLNAGKTAVGGWAFHIGGLAPRAAGATLTVLDVRGVALKEWKVEASSQGEATVSWDLQSARVGRVGPGIYAVRLQAGREWATTQLLLD